MQRKFFLIAGALALLAVFLWGAALGYAEVGQARDELPVGAYVPGEVLVKFMDTPTQRGRGVLRGAAAAEFVERLPAPARLALAEIQGEVLRVNADLGILRVRLRGPLTVEKAVQKLRQNLAVEYAQPNHLFRTLAAPNDPNFKKQWALNNTGQKITVNFFMYIYGTPDADIDWLEAWNSFGTSPAAETVVVVIDTGVQYTHPDLATRMWKNSGEVAGNGVDDDGNGIVDDVYGMNAIPLTNTGNPADDNGHGTHVAGIAAAQTNNKAGVAGVAWNAKIMALKFLNSQGSGSEFDAVECITYARNMKQARNIPRMVMNASWGAYENLNLPPFYIPPPPEAVAALYEAIQAAGNDGILFVAAAGNDGVNIDTEQYKMVPAGFDLDNIISVGGSDEDDEISSLYWASNYGPQRVDLFAPGNEIYSTVPTNKYGFKSGTSMAAPHVSGAAALVWGRFTANNHLEIKSRILNNVDPGGVRGKITTGVCVTGGRLNLNKALQ